MKKKLAVDWWIRQRLEPRFRQALSWGFAEHCYHVVENALDANRQKKVWPNSWGSYAMAVVIADEANLRRKRRGDEATQVFEILGMASLLDITPQQIPPSDCRAWLAAAIQQLCGQAPIKRIEFFVSYCLRELERHRERQSGMLARDRMQFVELPVNRDAIDELCGTHQLTFDEAHATVLYLKEALERCL